MQWGVGLLIDVGRAWGWSEVASFQVAFTAYLACCVAGYGCFALVKEDNPTP
jgi:hypothetical protein